MKPRQRNQSARPAIDLIEEAMHLVRRAPPGTLAAYYLGSLPFVLGLLFFWAEMSRSPFASQHLAGESLGLALLFVWMKAWQAIFARLLRARISGAPPAAFGLRPAYRLIVNQTALHATGLFLLPVSLLLTAPFGWVYAFYQNVTVLEEGKSAGLLGIIAKAKRQAVLGPGQNHLVLTILFGFGLFVFFNWTLFCLTLPTLAKSLLGIESVFTRSPAAMFNSTFFAAMFALTYLSVDPIVKTVYALRCFYGESRQTGEDLRAELKQIRAVAGAVALSVVFGVLGFAGSAAGAEGLTGRTGRTGLTLDVEAPPAVQAPELDKNIEQVMQQRKYTWRMPRDSNPPPAEMGVTGRFIDRAEKMVQHWLASARDWAGEWLRKLFHPRKRSHSGSSSGYGWIFSLQILLYTLIAAVLAALGVLAYRLLQKRTEKQPVLASTALQPVPDLTDENVGAEQLPEDSWTTLGRELLQKGELRLALRAFYLASLAHLAARNLISLARFKSNRDYDRELQRRAHSFPQLLSLFGDNVLVFDRVWYGRHELTPDLVTQFLAKVEQIKTGSVT